MNIYKGFIIIQRVLGGSNLLNYSNSPTHCKSCCMKPYNYVFETNYVKQ